MGNHRETPATAREQASPAAPGVRMCATTGLPVCLTAQPFIRMNAVAAVVFLLVGAIAAVLLGLTRWPAVHLLDAGYYYRFLTLHGLNMLIFWIIFMEIAILYFAGTSLLNTTLASKKAAWASFALMLSGALLVDVMIFAGKADGLFKAHPLFYLGIILFAVGGLVSAINVLATFHVARKNNTYGRAVPLVAFGALAAAIIAVLTFLYVAIAMVPLLLWSLGLHDSIEPAYFPVTWRGFGQASTQINVCATLLVWYFLGSVTTGAKPLYQAVCRGAFVLYILYAFFISLASAHDLLAGPALDVGAGWKILNMAFAPFLAVLASMIHGFAVPASVEGAMRGKGHDKGLFGWLAAAPWHNPSFASMFLSLVIFGFMGGITGVTLGTPQINPIARNTLSIPGHTHAIVVGGTTLAFMGLAYFVVPLLFQREYHLKPLARTQPYVFAIGIVMMSLGMTFAGSAGVPRRHWDIEFTGAQLGAAFSPEVYFHLGLVGVGTIIAFAGMLMFILLTVAAVFFGRSNAGRAMESWGDVEPALARASAAHAEGGGLEPHRRTSGTLVLAITLLVCFALYYLATSKALSAVWNVR